MKISMVMMILGLAFRLAVLAGAVYLAILVIRALRKYLRSGPARKEKAEDRRSLGEVLKEQRLRCQMTQEFVAETLGVSRQAVSKWERGEADPSTANLLALGRLYGVPAEELLRAVTGEKNGHLSRVNAQKSKNIFYEARMRAISSRKSCSEHR